jgi:hypothetical protein
MSGQDINLPLCQPIFKRVQPPFTFGRKRVLNYKDQPVFAELMILNLLRECGMAYGYRPLVAPSICLKCLVIIA